MDFYNTVCKGGRKSKGHATATDERIPNCCLLMCQRKWQSCSFSIVKHKGSFHASLEPSNVALTFSGVGPWSCVITTPRSRRYRCFSVACLEASFLDVKQGASLRLTRSKHCVNHKQCGAIRCKFSTHFLQRWIEIVGDTYGNSTRPVIFNDHERMNTLPHPFALRHVHTREPKRA